MNYSMSEHDPLTYKTEICRSHYTTGICEYGVVCQFAHGIEELRYREFDAKYKTELCKMYHLGELCEFNARCKFIHSEYRIRAGTYEFWLVSPDENIVRIEMVDPQNINRLNQLISLTEKPPQPPNKGGQLSPLPKKTMSNQGSSIVSSSSSHSSDVNQQLQSLQLNDKADNTTDNPPAEKHDSVETLADLLISTSPPPTTLPSTISALSPVAGALSPAMNSAAAQLSNIQQMKFHLPNFQQEPSITFYKLNKHANDKLSNANTNMDYAGDKSIRNKYNTNKSHTNITSSQSSSKQAYTPQSTLQTLQLPYNSINQLSILGSNEYTYHTQFPNWTNPIKPFQRQRVINRSRSNSKNNAAGKTPTNTGVSSSASTSTTVPITESTTTDTTLPSTEFIPSSTAKYSVAPGLEDPNVPLVTFNASTDANLTINTSSELSDTSTSARFTSGLRDRRRRNARYNKSRYVNEYSQSLIRGTSNQQSSQYYTPYSSASSAYQLQPQPTYDHTGYRMPSDNNVYSYKQAQPTELYISYDNQSNLTAPPPGFHLSHTSRFNADM